MKKKSKERIECELKTNDELQLLIGSYRSDAAIHASATMVLKEREFWKKFWTYGLVGWIALILSVINIVVLIVKE